MIVDARLHALDLRKPIAHASSTANQHWNSRCQLKQIGAEIIPPAGIDALLVEDADSLSPW